MSSPLHLYKYEPFTAQSLQNLKDQLIYFGSPLAFNDPYDCALSPRIKEPTDVDVERLRSHYLAKPEIENRIRREFETASPAALRLMLLRIGQKALDDMIKKFRASDKLACFLAVRPPLTYHLADIDATGRVREFRSSETSDMWINAGFFIMRNEIFNYMCEGEELVLEPFARLIADDKLMAYKHEGFWRSMDTLRDWQALEAMVERGDMPWLMRGSPIGMGVKASGAQP